MSLRTKLGLSQESSLEEGEPDDVAEKKRNAVTVALRPTRLEAHAESRSDGDRRERPRSVGVDGS